MVVKIHFQVNPLHAAFTNTVNYFGSVGLEVTPPGGDSFLMCLKPTIRTGTNNDMKLLTQAEFVYKCNVKAGKPAKLPTVQELE